MTLERIVVACLADGTVLWVTDIPEGAAWYYELGPVLVPCCGLHYMPDVAPVEYRATRYRDQHGRRIFARFSPMEVP